MIDERTGKTFVIPSSARAKCVEEGIDPDAPVDLDAYQPDQVEPAEPIASFGNAIGKFGKTAPDTSRRAAIGVYFKTDTQKHRLLTLIAGATDRGRDLTCDEAEALTGLPHQSLSARWNELWHDHQMIEPSGAERPTRAKKDAAAFVSNNRGREYLQQHGLFTT